MLVCALGHSSTGLQAIAALRGSEVPSPVPFLRMFASCRETWPVASLGGIACFFTSVELPANLQRGHLRWRPARCITPRPVVGIDGSRCYLAFNSHKIHHAHLASKALQVLGQVLGHRSL